MKQTTYMLRRVLCPWNWEQIIDETVAWCIEQRVDEIMWITESSGMYKELLPVPEIREIVARLRVAQAKTEAAGILYSINPLTTIGHGDCGNDVAAIHPGLEMMVDFRGGVSRSCTCTLSPVWLDLMRETFALYASTHPARLWIEDDFRYCGHGPHVRYGCYCLRHIKAFSERIGQAVTREELVDAMLRPGEPHPWRTSWLDFLEEALAEVAAMICKAAQDVSPQTELGWMTSNPMVHELEGRRVTPTMEALAGEMGHAAIRMTMSPRAELGHKELLKVDETLKKMIPRLPAGTTLCTELESHPHSAYTVSATRIGAEIEWACVLGVPHHTMNIFDYIGTPLAEEPTYNEVLRTRKDEFSAFLDAFAELGTFRGIGIPNDPGSARRVHTPHGADMLEFLQGEDGWVDPLRAFGMPIHSSKSETVTAVTGQGIWCMSDDELTKVFSRGVLLDASALQSLQDRGRAELAGAHIERIVGNRDRPTGPEELTDPDFGGGRYRYTWTYGFKRLAVRELDPKARPISRILDADGEFLYHGVVLFENALGGRVASFPHFCGATVPDQKGPEGPFYSPYRRQQFQALIPWLGRGPAPLMVHTRDWTLPHRADGQHRIGLAVMNINSDTWQGVRMSCATARKVRSIAWLDINGTRHKLAPSMWQQSAGQVVLTLDTTVPSLRTVACFLEVE
ncbi:MAG: hypothetical protein LC725_02995 [Lentisphaerae bacterium]|nr:hypothetical protein [Lentisphaerota bacterium]